MKTTLWFIFSLFVVFACEMDREFEVTIPAEKEKLVVNCVFAPNQKWKPQIFKSQGIISIENERDNILLNADVSVSEGDDQIPVPLIDEYGTYQSSALAEAGKTYTIHVSAPGYEPVSGTVVVPSAVEILGVETSLSVDPEDPRFDKRIFHIRFKDPANELNFYAFGMY
jgi:hypothetical protein